MQQLAIEGAFLKMQICNCRVYWSGLDVL